MINTCHIYWTDASQHFKIDYRHEDINCMRINQLGHDDAYIRQWTMSSAGRRQAIIWINSTWPSDAIWWHRTRSTLAQVMACCLTAPSNYLNQFWLISSEVLWYAPEGNITGNAQEIYPWYEFQKYSFKILAASPGGQWFNADLLLSNAPSWKNVS